MHHFVQRLHVPLFVTHPFLDVSLQVQFIECNRMAVLVRIISYNERARQFLPCTLDKASVVPDIDYLGDAPPRFSPPKRRGGSMGGPMRMTENKDIGALPAEIEQIHLDRCEQSGINRFVVQLGDIIDETAQRFVHLVDELT